MCMCVCVCVCVCNICVCSSSSDTRFLSGKTLVCEGAQHLEWWARWLAALLTRRCSLASEVRARAFFRARISYALTRHCQNGGAVDAPVFPRI